MGNKLYVDSNTNTLENLLKFDISNLANDIKDQLSHQSLKVWRFHTDNDIKISQPILLPNIKEDHFLLSSYEVYLILLIYKDEIMEHCAFPTNLWSVIESSSNMTPRGLLKYAYSSNPKSENLESFSLSNRGFIDSEYKYFIFIWNGKNSSAELRSEAMMSGFSLDNKLSDPSILPYLYNGYYIQEDKIVKGNILNLNSIINNTIEHMDEDQPSANAFLNYHETVYLLQWLYPMKNEEKDEEMENEEKEDMEVDDDSYIDENDTSSLGEEDNCKKKTGFNLQLGKLNLGGMTTSRLNNDVKVPSLNIRSQVVRLDDETVTNRHRQSIDKEEKMDNLPCATLRKASDRLIKENPMGLKLNLLRKNEEDVNNDDDLMDSERKQILMNYYDNNASEILDGFLYLSSYKVAMNEDIIKNLNITHIVNAATDKCQNHFEESVKYLNYNLKDHSMEVCYYNIEYRMYFL
jgi:hypothetical protein